MDRSDQSDAKHTCRAVVCSETGSPSLQRIQVRSPAAGELLLKLRACGFCGTDLFKLDHGGAMAGTVLGHELVGEVAAGGPGLDGFSLGDRIVVPHHVACGACHLCKSGGETLCPAFRDHLFEPGGFSELILIRERAARSAARRVPDDLSDDAAVFLEPAACVLRGIRRSGLIHEGVAVIFGAGCMGLLHLLVLRAALPNLEIVILEPDPGRLDRARKLGCEHAVDRLDAARELIQSLSRGLGADASFDTVGGAATFEAGFKLLREGGTSVLFAHSQPATLAAFELNRLFKSERRIVGTYSGSLLEQEEVFRMLTQGQLDPSPLVTHRLALQDFERGLELVRRRAALKVLFTPETSREAE